MFGTFPFASAPFAATSLNAVFAATVTENASSADTYVVNGASEASVIEAASGADTFLSFLPILSAVSETASSSSIFPANVIVLSSVEGAASGADSTALGNADVSEIIENATGTATVNGRNLWEDINASQNPNWVDIQAI
jgi:hypothetical protein